MVFIIGQAKKSISINFDDDIQTIIVNPSDFSNALRLDPLPTITYTFTLIFNPIRFKSPTARFSNPIQTFSNAVGEIKILYSNGITDIYNFYYSYSDVDLEVIFTLEISVKRTKAFSDNERVSGNGLLSKSINKTEKSTINDVNDAEVPILNILGQTLIDGSDIGNVIFTIQDKYQYYCPIPPEFNKCGTYHINKLELKTTIFDKSCPKIVSVVIGNGETWYDKTEYLFDKLGKEKIGANFGDFRLRMFLYAMLKFILARILYGKFNINFLLRKYNEKFLNDLSKSRFCEALHLFTDSNSTIFGYDKYFKLC